jgi:hypothetical protein
VGDFLTALALVLAIEGALYALFPDAMRRVMQQLLEQPEARIRALGLFCVALGVLGVWLIRG